MITFPNQRVVLVWCGGDGEIAVMLSLPLSSDSRVFWGPLPQSHSLEAARWQWTQFDFPALTGGLSQLLSGSLWPDTHPGGLPEDRPLERAPLHLWPSGDPQEAKQNKRMRLLSLWSQFHHDWDCRNINKINEHYIKCKRYLQPCSHQLVSPPVFIPALTHPGVSACVMVQLYTRVSPENCRHCHTLFGTQNEKEKRSWFWGPACGFLSSALSVLLTSAFFSSASFHPCTPSSLLPSSFQFPVFLVALAGRLLPILQTCLEPRDCGTQAGSALPPTYL